MLVGLCMIFQFLLMVVESLRAKLCSGLYVCILYIVYIYIPGLCILCLALKFLCNIFVCVPVLLGMSSRRLPATAKAAFLGLGISTLWLLWSSTSLFPPRSSQGGTVLEKKTCLFIAYFVIPECI